MTSDERDDRLQDVRSRFYNGDGYVECREGWYEIIIKIDRMLRFINPDYKIAQIKEKFGTLRYYFDYNFPDDLSDEEIDVRASIMGAVVGHQERISAYTCEYCGERGKTRAGGWYKTLCDSCAVKSGYRIDTTTTGSTE